jgi:hypothetical protein
VEAQRNSVATRVAPVVTPHPHWERRLRASERVAARGIYVILGALLLFYLFVGGSRLLAPDSPVPFFGRAPVALAPAEQEAAPPAEGEQPALPEAAVAPEAAPAAPPPAVGPGPTQAVAAAVPLLLSLFWLTCAYLFDSEARRLFVVRDDWGEQRRAGYNVVALGCVTPLLFLGLFGAAWGAVQLGLWTVRNGAWVASGRVLAAVAIVYLALATIRFLARPREAER